VPPLLPRSKRLRTALLVGAALVLVVVVALVLAGTADNGSSPRAAKAKAKAKKEKARAAARAKPVKLVLGRVVVQNTGLPTTVRPAVRRAVLSATQKYYNDAIQSPLRRGRVNNRYERVFAQGVRRLAADRDRAALTETATGPIRGRVLISASPVRIDALGDPLGKLALVAATFTLKTDAKTPTGARLAIRRYTELTFAYESGGWRVTAYRVGVRRHIGTKATTTTAHAGTATKP
jgi:hypothetical protein